ncbi:MAG TPA: polysaccharide deacetylase family protein [Chitinophagaceae bacterium]
MQTPVTPDEPEPSGYLTQYTLPLVLSIYLVACRPEAQENKPTFDAIECRLAPTKSIIVTARPKKPVKQKKKIYLTFDDGPNRGTKNVLDIVQQENVPVTFFIVGEHVFASAGQAAVWDSLKMAKNIELCNHSYTHAHNRYDKFYEEPVNVVKDMERTKDSLLPDNNIVRAPGRNSWRIDSLHYTDIRKSKAAMDSLQKAGFVVMGWDLEWHFDPKTYAVKNTADELLTQIDSVFTHKRTKKPDNLVLLAHDQAYRSSSDSLQLRDFIQKLKKKDEYELSLVSNYPDALKKRTDTLKTKEVRQGLDSL